MERFEVLRGFEEHILVGFWIRSSAAISRWGDLLVHVLCFHSISGADFPAQGSYARHTLSFVVSGQFFGSR